MRKYQLRELAQCIDYTNLKSFATAEDMKTLCREAMEYQFKTVAVNQAQVRRCCSLLQQSDVHVTAAIAFPLGQTTISSKAFETKVAIEEGAREIDYVLNLTEVKGGNFSYIEQEMKEIVMLCRDQGVLSKVIFENCYLNDDEIRKVSEIARKIRPDYIKTSTGFGISGATTKDIALMKEVVEDTVKVKASGGIRDAETFLEMIRFGAERIGTSAGISIMESLKIRLKNTGDEYIEI